MVDKGLEKGQGYEKGTKIMGREREPECYCHEMDYGPFGNKCPLCDRVETNAD